MALTRFSIVTLVFFIISTFFVIQPWSFHVKFPIIGRRKLTLGLMSAPILAIAILWASQCLGATQIRNGIVGTDNIKPYNILILFISLAYMAITLDGTGVLKAAAFWVSNRGGSRGRLLYLYFYVLLTAISVFVGNDPIILSGTVFLVYYTAATGLDPEAWLISEFAAANTASMVFFFGNPTNVVITEGFRINNVAYTAWTILPFLACSVACYLALMLQFRNEKYVPRRLNVTGTLNPMDVLQDKVSAIFGTIWLATCLIVIVVLSFFHVDVWMIVLPFAGGKFIFDIAWDHYRYKTGKIPKFDPTRSDEDDPMAKALQRAMSAEMERSGTTASFATAVQTHNTTKDVLDGGLHRTESPISSHSSDETTTTASPSKAAKFIRKAHARYDLTYRKLAAHFPTFFIALPRLPFGLIPFAFAQFILIEALQNQGWIEIFSRWLVIMTGGKMIPIVWIVGLFGVILCNVAGTNIGATILLTKIVRASNFDESRAMAAAVALAVASNIGAVSFTYSASLAGLLWDSILRDKGITIKQWRFAMWNALPLIAMTGVGLAIVTAEVVVHYW
ncbi:hypothetical protein CC1G_06926 [Coprinopsis cinerea okayama7|uniref:Citrate transporter-like domain-containing protein n=1 Tax=Coprinopsis cinerea (strain Okayama-7 / 130 / ATCC MYA-4618 / FGSC 9003) TaxID=240176 RepID=A8NZQ0_COPC7|nr:hypothetical protein CC1G_06926 [Coprinopsis cinerea okayama7\|eukprot:XP_001837720.1 hypothetical protein CC1G_06926 [Coprinopsis cinerea okayama7\